jgi:TPR repeat protein
MAARFVALVLLGLANAVAAQPRATSDAPGYDAGLQAYLAGDPAAAWFLWFGLAERGDAEAQFSMGHLYRVGEGVPRDPAMAADWFARAAAQGHGHAMLNLALMHEQGAGVARDLAVAYAHAARAGRLLEGESLERARTAAARIALVFQPTDAERARRLLIEMDRRQPLAVPRAQQR